MGKTGTTYPLPLLILFVLLLNLPLVVTIQSQTARGGQRYFFGGCAFARMLPFFILPLALDRNDFKFASALSAIPL